MTLIVGIKCSDGVVLAADSAATISTLGQHTIRQEVHKLEILAGKAIFAASGSVGLAQLQAAKIADLCRTGGLKSCEQARPILSKAIWEIAKPGLEAAQLSGKVLGQAGITPAICQILLALTLSKPPKPHLIEFDQQGGSTEFGPSLPFVAIGSGQVYADPFLAFIRRIFWPTKLPNLAEGKLTGVWTLRHSIQVAPAYVAEPIELAVIERDKKSGDWIARILPKEEMAEHDQMVDDMENHLRAFKTTIETPPNVGETIAPPLPSSP